MRVLISEERAIGVWAGGAVNGVGMATSRCCRFLHGRKDIYVIFSDACGTGSFLIDRPANSGGDQGPRARRCCTRLRSRSSPHSV
eukprot:g16859.t1